MGKVHYIVKVQEESEVLSVLGQNMNLYQSCEQVRKEEQMLHLFSLSEEEVVHILLYQRHHPNTNMRIFVMRSSGVKDIFHVLR